MGPVAQYVCAQSSVRDLGGDVEHAGCGIDGVEVLGEGLPLPVDAFVQGGAGDVLHALHQLDQERVAVGPRRREADSAVAHHHGGDAVPAGGADLRVPRDLAVVVGVDVDP